MEGLEEGGPLGGVGCSAIEVNDMDHVLPLRCLKDGLVGNKEGKANEGAKVEEVAAGEDLGHQPGRCHQWRVEGMVEARLGVEDMVGRGIYAVRAYFDIHAVTKGSIMIENVNAFNLKKYG
ncbi:hypothetical protein COCNU_scaffold003156G000020 [Cocos nucifera]|nr:hypothetical protein [Cocos nucifera]